MFSQSSNKVGYAIFWLGVFVIQIKEKARPLDVLLNC